MVLKKPRLLWTSFIPPVRFIVCKIIWNLIHLAKMDERSGKADYLIQASSPAAGVVLHFKIPALTDYYIINPQQWFDLCALVISPENVSKLVKRSIGRGR